MQNSYQQTETAAVNLYFTKSKEAISRHKNIYQLSILH